MRQLEDGDNLEKRVSVYKDIVVTGVRDVPDSAAICTAAISGRTLSKEENTRLVRKIDFNLMPLLCVVYLIQFVSIAFLSKHQSPSASLFAASLTFPPRRSSRSPPFPPSFPPPFPAFLLPSIVGQGFLELR